jgi:hypothetical protein
MRDTEDEMQFAGFERMLQAAQPEVRLASAVVLHRLGRTDRQQVRAWGQQVAELLGHDHAAVRARCLWVLSRLFSRQFADFNTTQPPSQVSANALQAGIRWVEEQFGLRVELTEAMLAEHAAERTLQYSRRRAEAPSEP